MIYIKDNFLSKTLFNKLNKKLIKFKKVDMSDGDCVLYVIESPKELTDHFKNLIEKIEGKKIKMIMCGFRQSQKNEDDVLRIHSDLHIHPDQSDFPERAGVLYMSDIPKDLKKELTGTAFWDHETHGDNNKGSIDIHNETMKNCADKSKWTLRSVIGHKQNRFLSYNSNYFHSKYPNKSIDKRKVCVMFYKYEKM